MGRLLARRADRFTGERHRRCALEGKLRHRAADSISGYLIYEIAPTRACCQGCDARRARAKGTFRCRAEQRVTAVRRASREPPVLATVREHSCTIASSRGALELLGRCGGFLSLPSISCALRSHCYGMMQG
jgi:hypothetical protein